MPPITTNNRIRPSRIQTARKFAQRGATRKEFTDEITRQFGGFGAQDLQRFEQAGGARSVAKSVAETAAGLEAPRLATPSPERNIRGLTDAAPSVTQGSEQFRQARNQTQARADKFLSELGTAQAFTQQTFEESIQGLQDLIARSDELSQADLAQITEAGAAAGARFDPAIARAQEAARQGLARAVVGAGERGGFLSTQRAGQAALTPVVGDTFVGRGGELSRVKGQLDLNIVQLEQAKNDAIFKAEQAARNAIRTGNQDQLRQAQQFAEFAIQAAQSRESAISKRIEVLGTLEQQARAGRAEERVQVGFEQEQEDRRIESIVAPLFNRFTEDTEANQALIDQAARESGVDPNRLRARLDEFTREQEADAFFKGSDIVSLIKTLPEGQSTTLTDPNTGRVFEIEGAKKESPTVNVVTDDQGTVRGIDKNTGEVLWEKQRAGKTKAAPVSLIIKEQTGAILAQITNDFLQNVGGDGKVSAQKYGEQQRVFQSATGLPAKDFKDQYPPQEWLDPADPNARQFFQTRAEALEGEEGEESLF